MPNLKLLDARILLDILTVTDTPIPRRPDMDTQPAFGLQDVIACIAGQAADAVSQRTGETRQQQDGRALAATDAIMAFQPCDAVEAMLASHCLMFHEMIVADVHRTLCGENVAAQRATRNGIVAMDKAFGANLIRLKQHRTARLKEPQPAADRAETRIGDRIRRHLSQTERQDQDVATTASDPAGSEADAITETWPAAAHTAGLNRQARRALDRQTHKRAAGFSRPGITPDRNEPTTTISATTAG